MFSPLPFRWKPYAVPEHRSDFVSLKPLPSLFPFLLAFPWSIYKPQMALLLTSNSLFSVANSRPRSFDVLAPTSTRKEATLPLHLTLNVSKISPLRNLVAYRHVKRRGLFVVNVGASAGMPNDGKKLSFDDLKEKFNEIWEKCPLPVKMFPWNIAADNFKQLILDLFLAVVKYLSLPVFALTSVSELSYCAHEKKLFFTPIPMVIGIFIAGVLKETLLDLSPLLREAEVEVPWHLIGIAALFTILKLPGPYYSYWARIFIPHMANGALLRTLWFALQWYRTLRKTAGV